MTSKLQQQLRQTKPFRSVQQEAILNLIRTADVMQRQLEQALKPFNITHTQYNVLRILRGAGPAGHNCSAVAQRLVAHDPDVTRLIDRLDTAGLVLRNRCPEDRRKVILTITEAGLKLLTTLDRPIDELDERLLKHMKSADLKILSHLLEEAREPYESAP